MAGCCLSGRTCEGSMSSAKRTHDRRVSGRIERRRGIAYWSDQIKVTTPTRKNESKFLRFI